MIIEDLSSEERYVLSRLNWQSTAELTDEDKIVCRQLEAKGLLSKVAKGGWELTPAGRFRAACGR